MMRFLSFVLLLTILCAKKTQAPLEITADSMITDQQAGKSIISGNVTIVHATDKLNTNEVTVFFDTSTKRPIRYEANGNVEFSLQTEDMRVLKGRANKAIFKVDADTYELQGNATIQEIGKPNEIQGDIIMLNRSTGFANVQGTRNNANRQPARIIFEFTQPQSP